MTYIGKKYKANDNSFSINLTDVGGCRHNLAGTVNEDAKTAEIVSEPYKQEVRFHGNTWTYDFINVLYKGDTIRVMFNKRNVIKEPKGITAETFMDIGKLFEEFCGGSKKEEPSEADKLRSEITFLREELNKHREEFKQQKSIKSREEIEDQISKQVVMKLFSSSKEAKETRGVAINVLNWVLNKD